MGKHILIMVMLSLLMAPAFAMALQEDDENPREFKEKGVSGNVTGQAQADDARSGGAVKKEKIIQVGALEKIEGDRYILRKVQTRLDFYMDDNTRIFMKTDGTAADITEKSFVDIRGPRNKKAVLANTVYIYPDKKTYDEMVDKDSVPASSSAGKKTFSGPLTGIVKQKEPLMITADDNKEYEVCFDEDTLWINDKPALKADMILGDRMKTYYDKRLTLRYKSVAVKVVIDKSKAGFEK